MGRLRHSPRASRSLPLLAACSILLAAQSCDATAEVWVEPDSTAERLLFGLALRRSTGEPVPQVKAFFVRRCGAVRVDWPPEIVWRTTGPPVAASPTRYRYGEAPPGWENAIGPQPLSPGCYTAGFAAPGYRGLATFYVTAAGAIIPEQREERQRPDTPKTGVDR